MSKKILIAIDLDRTWTVDPDFWNEFYLLALKYGHEVILATARNGYSDDMDRYDLPTGMCKVFSKGEPKRQACLDAGWDVDVWIDDMPSMIDGGLLINPNEEL